MKKNDTFCWKFVRIGGLDQVTLQTADELTHLDELDPKLWAALSCPAAGLEFDERTLELLDTDHDGRIRIPEVRDAVRWTCARLADPASLVNPPDDMPLSAIRSDTPDGQALLAAAQHILETLNKPESDSLNQREVMDAAAHAAQHLFNGDGIFPPDEHLPEDVRSFISQALTFVGGRKDAGGQPGIDSEISAAFLQLISDWKAWQSGMSALSLPLGDDTARAWALMRQLRPKIDDYFLRCQLASFAPGIETGLASSAEEKFPSEDEHGILQSSALAELPLARVEAERPLRPDSGINPAWADQIAELFRLLAPLLPRKDSMSRADWLTVQTAFGSYVEAVNGKPAPQTSAPVDIPPSAQPEDMEKILGTAGMDKLLNGDAAASFDRLVQKDLAVPAGSGGIADVEKLVIFHRHLHRLLMNFVSFHDFYNLSGQAAFQNGVLYMDGRSCRLCVPVANVDKHSAMAAFSNLCLAYCECRRIRKSSADRAPEGTITIVAAVTQGDADLLIPGRNGVFVDNMGNDWDATLIKLVQAPISLRQALWAPYKRMARMATEQLAKYASSKTSSVSATAARKLDTLTKDVSSGKSPGFDIGKSAGIFAAVGLAMGALGTALASIVQGLLSLSWWQLPLLVLALLLVFSGPSLLMAWLKLHKRTLGPLLEASGWAVNSFAPINLRIGAALTQKAKLPPNVHRDMKDPFRDRNPAKWPALLLLIALLSGAVAGGLIYTGLVDNPFSALSEHLEHSESQTPSPARK